MPSYSVIHVNPALEYNDHLKELHLIHVQTQASGLSLQTVGKENEKDCVMGLEGLEGLKSSVSGVMCLTAQSSICPGWCDVFV